MSSSVYRTLAPTQLIEFLRGLPDVRDRIGGPPESWTVREVGDGNLNLVFIVEGAGGAVCVKQALPYVRAAGPSWPMSLERAYFENSYYRAVAPHVEGLIPAIYHYDSQLYCTVMERLSPHVILRHGLIEARRYDNVARDLGEYVARASFFTSDFALPFERKLDGITLFAGNKALIRITVDLIFRDPYVRSERNRHTTPQLDHVAAEFRDDEQLKVSVAHFGQKFLTDVQALVHGDLHSGSIMVTPQDTRVIDPEFAFYGPIGFDLGAFFGNLLLNWYAQPGYATAQDDRAIYRAWLLEQTRIFWQTFRARFLELWASESAGDAFPNALVMPANDRPPKRAANPTPLHCARNAFLDSLFADMLGFGACKMIRRILGFAHVIDFDRIADADRRGVCEARALTMARTLLIQPQCFNSMDDVIDAVTLGP